MFFPDYRWLVAHNRILNKYRLIQSKQKMKKLRFLIFLACISASLLFFSLINQSYAQEDFPDIKPLAENKTFIFVQTFVHNSQGQMVTYLASEKFSYIDTTALTNLLNFEESEADKIIEINGKKFF